MRDEQDLAAAIEYLELEMMRLGLNKRGFEILTWCQVHGYPSYEDLDLSGMRRLWLDLKKSEPSPGWVRVRPGAVEQLQAEVRSVLDRLGHLLKEG